MAKKKTFPILMSLLLVSAPLAARALDYSRVQTYGMLPLDPAQAAEKGWTVNGLWAGFGQAEAVRSSTHVESAPGEYPVKYSYPSMKDYVEASHAEGLLVPGSMTGVAGNLMLRTRFPEMEIGACVGADGKRAYWDPSGDGTYFMCVNNPIYRDVLYQVLTEAYDAGADLLLIDEFAGNEACFYWSNEPGFCEYCLDAYRNHLRAKFTPAQLEEKFGIDDLDTFDFAKALTGQRMKLWPDTSPLFKELWRVQERKSYESRLGLATDLRAYMKKKGRVVPIVGNISKAGLNAWAGGHWLNGQKWTQVLDFLAFENAREDADAEMLPRGKWVAQERLAAASYDLPSAVIHMYPRVHGWEAEYMEGKSNHGVYLYAMAAEANANGCHYVNYFQTAFFPQTEPLWNPVFRCQQFIRGHRDIFEPAWETGANVAVLYIENEGMRTRTETYVGAATALAESNIPFDVVVDGGTDFVPATLRADDLRAYDAVIAPAASHLADTQRQALVAYVAGGGTLITPDAAGFEGEEPGKGEFVLLEKSGDSDIAAAYSRTFDDGLRARLASLVREHAEPTLEAPGADRTLSVYPRYQPGAKRAVVHLINSDYDKETGKMRPKKDVQVRLKRPAFMKDAPSARIYSPDFDDIHDTKPLDVRTEGEWLEFTLPELDVYSVVVVQP